MEAPKFYVGKNDNELDRLLDPKPLMKLHPEYYGPKFGAISELRKADDGTLHKGQPFRRVASFVNMPLFQAAKTLLDESFMKDKNRFYAFLDRNREYLTYDRRKGSRPIPNSVTYFDGKEV